MRLPIIARREENGRSDSRPEDRQAVLSKRVLVVDDNEDSAKTLSVHIKHRGHRVGMAQDGAEALRMALILTPEVIVLDIGLPIVDGYEVARRIRQLDSLRGCKLIALTGYGTVEDRERCMAAGFDAHLVKPVEMAVLLDVIEG